MAGFELREVAGHSLAPELYPGDIVLAWRGPWYFRPGQLVLIDSEPKVMIKRLLERRDSDSWLVGGQEVWGRVHQSAIRGPVLFCWRRRRAHD